MSCGPCEGTGFVNLGHVPEDVIRRAEAGDFVAVISAWRAEYTTTDVGICTCCGDGEDWHGEPGEHDEGDYGHYGPYGYNGGLPECF